MSSMDDVIERYRRELDLDLIRVHLRRTPEERLIALMELQKFAEELRRAGKAAHAAPR